MSTLEHPRTAATHEVANQATPLEDYNTYETDQVLVEALRREGGDWAETRVSEVGAFAGSARGDPLGLRGEREPAEAARPTTGSATASTRSSSTRPGTSCSAPGSASASTRCRGASRSRAPTSPAAAMFVASQAEAGVGCPISMTYSVIPALRKQPELAAEWEPRFTSLDYDGERLRPAADKPGALCGMGMTEKQGGSDVRANTTVAAPLNGGGPGRRVRAHRPQVVHVGADVRRLPRPRPGRGRALLLSAAPLHP